MAAKLTGKPVTWIADRTEHFLGDTHGRDNITTARLALDKEGRFLALEVDTIADMGAYLSTYAPYIPYVGAGLLPGVYDFASCFIRVRAAYTNTVPVDAYRGAGRPEASYVIERLVDAAARELGIAPDALRRKNFIRPEQMPYKTATGKTYDTGEFDGQMSRALKLADWDGFVARADTAREHGLASRYRNWNLYRGLRRPRPRHRDPVACKGRNCPCACRHPDHGTGSRHGLFPDRGGSFVAAARSGAHAAGRHRTNRDRQWHRRLEFDSGRRQFGCDGSGETRRSVEERGFAMYSKPIRATLNLPTV